MKRIAGKNTDALKTLYGRYDRQIFNFILRYTGSREIAQELIQETFTRIWTAAHTFDQKRGNFKGWLYTIALNITRNEMSKKEYTYHFLDVDEVSEKQHRDHDDKNDNPHTLLEQNELKNAITTALGTLKPHLREIIIMKNYQHLKFREIAEATQIPEGTLKARYHRATALLKEKLSPMGSTPAEVTNHA
jgi:RNA polymerase sigma-70 factor (ECF subfamily)